MSDTVVCPVCGKQDRVMAVPKRMYDVDVGILVCCRCKVASYPAKPAVLLAEWEKGNVEHMSNNAWRKLVRQQHWIDQCLMLKRTELSEREARIAKAVQMKAEIDEQVRRYGQAFILDGKVIPADQVEFVYEDEKKDEKWKVIG